MQLCPGGTVAVLFSGPILEGFAPDRRNTIALLCNAAALPGCLIALYLADRVRVGRRSLLMASGVGQALGSLALGLFVMLKTRNISFLEGEDLSAFAVAALALLQFSYALGWGIVVSILTSELMPARIRGLGTATAQAIGAAFQTAIASSFLPLGTVQTARDT
jgi:MFS family permease